MLTLTKEFLLSPPNWNPIVGSSFACDWQEIGMPWNSCHYYDISALSPWFLNKKSYWKSSNAAAHALEVMPLYLMLQLFFHHFKSMCIGLSVVNRIIQVLIGLLGVFGQLYHMLESGHWGSSLSHDSLVVVLWLQALPGENEEFKSHLDLVEISCQKTDIRLPHWKLLVLASSILKAGLQIGTIVCSANVFSAHCSKINF
jgi:hypothetical protein